MAAARPGTNILNAVPYCSEETSLKVVIPRIEIHSGRKGKKRRVASRNEKRATHRGKFAGLRFFSRTHERHVVNNNSYRPTKLLIYPDGTGARARRRETNSQTRNAIEISIFYQLYLARRVGGNPRVFFRRS